MKGIPARYKRLIEIAEYFIFCKAFTLLLFGMVLLLIGLYGVHADVGAPSEYAIPMAILAVSLLAGASLYRTLFPFAPNQDFRFSVLFIVPAAYYVLRGVQAALILQRYLDKNKK
jgi:hypothetical protein